MIYEFGNFNRREKKRNGMTNHHPKTPNRFLGSVRKKKKYLFCPNDIINYITIKYYVIFIQVILIKFSFFLISNSQIREIHFFYLLIFFIDLFIFYSKLTNEVWNKSPHSFSLIFSSNLNFLFFSFLSPPD